MTKTTASPGFAQQADVFLSYARSDLDAARSLVASLAGEGLEVALDVTHLMPGEDYAQRLDALLLASAKLVFLATPESLASEACRHELDLARRHAKPILPVLAPALAKTDLPEELREVQYLRLAAPDLIPRLDAAIRTDLDWERSHAEYERLAARGTDAIIPSRRDVQQAQDWLTARPQNATPVSEPVRNLIARSQKRLRQRSRAIFAGLISGTAVLAALAVGLYFQWQKAREQTGVAEAQTLRAEEQTAQARNSLGILFAGEAERLATEFQTDAALLTLLEASTMVLPADVPRLESVFARVLPRAEAEHRFTIPGDSIAFNDANTLYYQVPSDGGLWRIDPETGPVRIADWPGTLVYTAQVAPQDGYRLVMATHRGDALLLSYADPATGQQGLQVEIPVARQDWAQAFDIDIGPDGVGLVTVRPDYDYLSPNVVLPEGRLDRVTAVDLRGGHSAPVDQPDYDDPRLRADATGHSQIMTATDYFALPGDGWRGAPPLRFDSAGALTAVAPPTGTLDLAPLIDCLARGQYPSNVAEAAAQLQSLDEGGLYAEPGYSDPPPGTCLPIGDDLVFVGSFGTSAGGATNVDFLSSTWNGGRFGAVGGSQELYGRHFRPSVMIDGYHRAVTALDLNSVLVFEAGEYLTLGTSDPRTFEFPYLVGDAALSSSGHLVTVERSDLIVSRPELRVTSLAPSLVLPEEATTDDPSDEPPPYSIDATETGTALFRSDGSLFVDLPPFIDRYTPFAVPADLETADRISLLVTLDLRAVERITRDEQGEWSRETLFVAPRAIRNLTLHPDNNLLIVGMSLGGGEVEARVWSLADRREVAFLGENYKWMDFRLQDDGSLMFLQTGASTTSLQLAEGQARAQAALATTCLPATPGMWRTSPCWPSHL